MTSRIQKRLLLPNRVRLPPHEGFSWVDRRFLQDYAARLSRDAILLYFFFTAVSDQQGLSFYSDATIAVRLNASIKRCQKPNPLLFINGSCHEWHCRDVVWRAVWSLIARDYFVD